MTTECLEESLQIIPPVSCGYDRIRGSPHQESEENKIKGECVIPLAFIQLTDSKQNLVCNKLQFKLQPVVMLQSGAKQPAVIQTINYC